MNDQRYWTIRVTPTRPELDGVGRGVSGEAHELGLTHVTSVRSSKLYFLDAALDARTVEQLARRLLADPVAERATVHPGLTTREDAAPAVEVQSLPGVMDPVAITTRLAIRRELENEGLSPDWLREVRTGTRFEVFGAGSHDDLTTLARGALYNLCIQRAFICGLDPADPLPPTFPEPVDKPFELRRVTLQGLDGDALARLSREGHLFLSIEEMTAIQAYYQRLGREPTDLELETLAQTWSEHCVHKTLKSAVVYTGDDFGVVGALSNDRGSEQEALLDGRRSDQTGRSRRLKPAARVTVRFESLFKDTIVAATEELKRDWCLSVFKDNAGIIALDDEYAVAFKVETHNHPSAIEPYGGAATGVGGCIRDIMGCGLGAKPIASTDVFCLADPRYEAARVPRGVLHPRRVLRGVVGGVRDYGNRMGIPTVNGAIYFDDRYLANPLVFCGCVGLIPRDRIEKKPRTGDLIVLAGGRTGRDGIHGATFSSAELGDTHADEFSHAVQIGNAIEEKKLLDAMLMARDHAGGCLYTAVTDCGAGGLSSAVGEMGEALGAEVDLEKVPLKYAGLTYDEIWISEAQERMVFAVPPANVERMLAVFAGEEVEATVIGTFTGDRVLHVRYRGETVGRLETEFLHHGLPMRERRATWSRAATVRERLSRRLQPARSDEATKGRSDEGEERHEGTKARRHEGELADRLLCELRDLNVASREWVIRQYDHEVQGRSVVKPLTGPCHGPSDAAVLRPRLETDSAVAVACGLCPGLGEDDPYWMAVAAVDEALRNVICVGGDPDRTAILDNFCWPKVDTPESLGALVRACRGAADAAVAFGLPFISGKDSLNNEFTMDAAEAQRVGLPPRIAIPHTLLISAISVIDDVHRCITMDLKEPGHVVVLASAPVREVGMRAAFALHGAVAGLIRAGKVFAAHDVSDGGILAALAEMSIASGLGMTVDLGAECSLDNGHEGGTGKRTRLPMSSADPQTPIRDPRPEDTDNGVPLSVPPAEGDGTDAWFARRETTYLLEMTPADAATDVAAGWPVIATVTDDGAMSWTDKMDAESWSIAIQDLAQAWRAPLAEGGR